MLKAGDKVKIIEDYLYFRKNTHYTVGYHINSYTGCECLTIKGNVIQDIQGYPHILPKDIWEKIPAIKLRRKRV